MEYTKTVFLKIPRYNMLHNNKTPRGLLVGMEVCTAEKPSILNITLNSAQHEFFSSVYSENLRA